MNYSTVMEDAAGGAWNESATTLASSSTSLSYRVSAAATLQLLTNGTSTAGLEHIASTLATSTSAADLLLLNNHNDRNNNNNETSGEFNWSFISVLVFVVAGTVGNVLVCLAVWLERPLQNVTNWFLVSLAFADLIVSTIVMPFGATAGFLGYWPLGVTWCNVYVTCDVLACSASILHMCCISLGRYLGIRSPLRARGYGGRSGGGSSFLAGGSSKRLVIVRVVLVWLLALLISSPISALGLIDPSNIMNGDQCVINNRGFAFAASLAAFYVPMIIMVVSYALTVHLLRNKARQHQQQMLYRIGGGSASSSRRDTAGSNRWTGSRRSFHSVNFAAPPDDKVMTVDEAINEEPPSQERGTQTPSSVSRERKRLIWKARISFSSLGSSLMGSARIDQQQQPVRIVKANRRPGRCRKVASGHDPGSASSSSRRRSFALLPNSSSHNISSAATVANEQKASKVLGVVFFTFVLCWAPFFLLNLLMAVWPSSADHIPERLVATCLWLGYVSSTINPLIYTVFNRTFKRVFIRLLKCRCKKSPVVPASASANNVTSANAAAAAAAAANHLTSSSSSSASGPARYGRCSSVYEGLSVHAPAVNSALSRYR